MLCAGSQRSRGWRRAVYLICRVSDGEGERWNSAAPTGLGKGGLSSLLDPSERRQGDRFSDGLLAFINSMGGTRLGIAGSGHQILTHKDHGKTAQVDWLQQNAVYSDGFHLWNSY